MSKTKIRIDLFFKNLYLKSISSFKRIVLIKKQLNEEINELLSEYFRKHAIPDFEIGDIKLQIIGKFK